MKYSANYNMNKPELNEQYRLDHWNENTDTIDTQLKVNANAISAETTRATNAETALQNITNETFKTALLNFCYPVGSLYWSSNSANPSTLFGGTWVQIKDRFVWAKGDSDTVNATGGAKTVTLDVANLPSHNHTFTPSGSISVTTNPTFTGSAVTSGANNRGHTHSYSHTHGYTPSGTVSSHTHGLNAHTHSFSWSGSHSHNFQYAQYGDNSGSSFKSILCYGSSIPDTVGRELSARSVNTKENSYMYIANTTISVSGTTGGNSGNTTSTQPTFTGTAGTTTSQSTTTSGAESQNHTHSVTASGTISGGAYKFTGTAGTTGGTGSGTAVNKMPPYIVKYCWERTA